MDYAKNAEYETFGFKPTFSRYVDGRCPKVNVGSIHLDDVNGFY